MQIRSLLKQMFNNKPTEISTFTSFKMLNDMSIFSNFGNDLYKSSLVRSCVHVIASNTAKLKPKHINRVDGRIENVIDELEQQLQTKPNKYMNTFDFLYKVTTRLLLDGNAFIYCHYELGGYQFFPVNFANLELFDGNGEVYCKFSFHQGQTVVIPYSELIHLRRNFNDSDFFGSKPDIPLLGTLEVLNTCDQGITANVKNATSLRGLLKYTNSMLKPEDLKRERTAFVNDYMNLTNNGGIAAIDAKAEFVELKNNPLEINEKLLQFEEQKILRFFNLNEDILTNKFNEDTWNAFYEGVIEPIALQLSLEFSNKLFPDSDEEIIFEANRLQYASSQTKTTMLKELMPLGIFTINEAREIFNLSPVKDGDNRLQTLNVVDANKAKDYQGVGGESDDANKNSDIPKPE